MKQSNTSTFIRLCALVATFVLVGADLAGLAQNTNSSTTNDTSAQNTNTTTRTGGRRRRGGRRAASTGNMNANTGEPGDNANMSTGEPAMQNTNDNTNTGEMTAPTTGTGGRRRRGGRRGTPPAADTGMPAETSGAMPTMQGGGTSGLGRVGETASLDGTYTGTINYPEGGMTGDATLTITGNTFTLESGGNTQTGTLTSQQWPGQIAVTMRFGTETPAKIISLRAKKTGNRLMLTSTSGESHQFSFRSGGGGMGGGRRRGRRRGAMSATPAEPATPPAEPGTESATPAEPAMPTGGRRRRGGRRRGGNMNANMTSDNANMTGNENTGEMNTNTGDMSGNMNMSGGRRRRGGTRRGSNRNMNSNTGDNVNNSNTR